MQFRLTKNFATDCALKNLQDFTVKSHPLDDWFIDYFHAPRKKIAMIVHGKTLFTFFISYEEAGGAKKISEKFHQILNDFFESHGILHLKNDVDALFSEGLTFTKTSDRTILGHMNDFVRCSQPYPHETSPFDCINQAININNMPVRVTQRNAIFPIDEFNALLGIHIPRRR